MPVDKRQRRRLNDSSKGGQLICYPPLGHGLQWTRMQNKLHKKPGNGLNASSAHIYCRFCLVHWPPPCYQNGTWPPSPANGNPTPLPLPLQESFPSQQSSHPPPTPPSEILPILTETTGAPTQPHTPMSLQHRSKCVHQAELSEPSTTVRPRSIPQPRYTTTTDLIGSHGLSEPDSPHAINYI